ncbi:hypothetical protein ALC62_13464, partial [Cyphomyrmex costatus]
LVGWCVAASGFNTDAAGPPPLASIVISNVTGAVEPPFSTWDTPRPCPRCGRFYSNNSNLRRHLRAAHATAPDLLQLTSLQRKTVVVPVQRLSDVPPSFVGGP